MGTTHYKFRSYRTNVNMDYLLVFEEFNGIRMINPFLIVSGEMFLKSLFNILVVDLFVERSSARQCLTT